MWTSAEKTPVNEEHKLLDGCYEHGNVVRDIHFDKMSTFSRLTNNPLV